MANSRTATTAAEARRLQLEILDQADKLADRIRKYLIQVGSTGTATPIPPRPKREVVDRVTYSALMLELLFRGRSGSGR